MTSKRTIVILVITLLGMLTLGACNKNDTKMKDGFYTAEMAEYDDFGWKEYVTLYIADDKIVTVDYNAKNTSGFIKSWDMEYMRLMNESDGTYPNKYTREYAQALLNHQNPEKIDAITGATHSYETFQMLVKAAMIQAENGDKNVAFINTSGEIAQ